MPLKRHPEIKVNKGCHREERSDVTISSAIASISTSGIIEAMPLWIATHSFGMLATTDQDIIYKGATGIHDCSQRDPGLSLRGIAQRSGAIRSNPYGKLDESWGLLRVARQRLAMTEIASSVLSVSSVVLSK